jgi:hypothetical protein
MAALSEEERDHADRRRTACSEASRRLAQIGRHELQERKFERERRRLVLKARSDTLERFGPARVARAVCEQEDANLLLLLLGIHCRLVLATVFVELVTRLASHRIDVIMPRSHRSRFPARAAGVASTANGWFAACPYGTCDICTPCAQRFVGRRSAADRRGRAADRRRCSVGVSPGPLRSRNGVRDSRLADVCVKATRDLLSILRIRSCCHALRPLDEVLRSQRFAFDD